MISYVTGDATKPQGEGAKIIAHVCNCEGGWGAGFVLAISKRWTGPEKHYRALAERNLGDVHLIKVAPEIWVANMIAQRGYGTGNRNLHRSGEPDSEIPLRYDALEASLQYLAKRADHLQASIHCPRLGCALAGGSWSKVEALIESTLSAAGIAVTVYDFPGGLFNP
jgi:hypothetical protein